MSNKIRCLNIYQIRNYLFNHLKEIIPQTFLIRKNKNNQIYFFKKSQSLFLENLRLKNNKIKQVSSLGIHMVKRLQV